MGKKSLITGLTIAALSVAGCSHDDDVRVYSNQEKLSNAAAQLEIDSIDPHQDWRMTTSLTAQVSVGLGIDQDYTVVVYDQNPLFNKDVVFYAQNTVQEGETVEMTFNAPAADSVFFVAVFDSQYRRLVQAAPVEDGFVKVNFGGSAVSASRARAAETDADATGYAKTLNDFLNPTGVDSWINVDRISIEEMKAYTPIDDTIVGSKFQGRSLQNPEYENGNKIVYGDHRHYRVPKDVELRQSFSTNGYSNTINGLVLYIEGKVHLVGTNSLNDITLVVADGGEIILDASENHFSGTGRFVVCAGGKITGIDGAAFNVNNGGWSYNAGTIDYQGTLNLNGSRFYNNNTVNVDILMGTAQGTHFTNFGKIKARTNAMQADAYNQNIVNGCYMQFTENAGVGGLTMLKNSRLDVGGQLYITGNGLWGGFRNELHDASMINAGSMKCNGATIYGPTNNGEAAIVKVGSVYANNDTDLQTANLLYMDWNADNFYIYDGTKVDQSFYNYYYMRGLVNRIANWSEESTSTYVIPQGDCTGTGYHDTSTPPVQNIPGRPAVWTYAFEDSPLGDYDMNDVVIKVSYHYDEDAKTVDESKLDITLCCTGAALSLRVWLGDQVLFGNKEVHDFLGQRAGTLINTGLDPDVDYASSTINTPEGFSFADADFWIDSPSVIGGVHIAKQGEDPHGIVIPADWEWPIEYVCIKEAYPNFVEFAKNAATTDESVKGWYKKTDTNPVENRVYRKD